MFKVKDITETTIEGITAKGITQGIPEKVLPDIQLLEPISVGQPKPNLKRGKDKCEKCGKEVGIVDNLLIILIHLGFLIFGMVFVFGLIMSAKLIVGYLQCL